MSRRPKPAAAAPQTDAPEMGAPHPATPQGPEPTGAASAPPSAAGEAAAVPVGPNPHGDGPQHEPATAAGFILLVKGPAKGRWRAGRKFGPEPVEILAAELTEEDMQKLMTDPELTVTAIGEPSGVTVS